MEIPELAFQFAKLTLLDISKNQIKYLPLGDSRIEGWSQLRSLNLADNDISELPPEISQLDELMMLDLTRNDQITSIPNELGLLKNLFSLKLDGLTRLQIPKDMKPVEGKNVRPLLEFLSQRLRKQVQHSYLKVFLAGRCAKLKRIVLQALDPETTRKSDGRIVSESLDVINFTIEPDRLDITLWDLPYGNMYSAQPFFMSERAIYILTYDNSTEEEMKTWRRNIQTRAPKAPIIFIYDHTANVEASLNISETSIFNNLHEHISIESDSTAEKDRIRKSFFNLIDNFVIDGVQVTKELIPKSYLDLERLIISMSGALAMRGKKSGKVRSRHRIASICFSSMDSLNSIEKLELNLSDREIPVLTRLEIVDLCSQHGIELDRQELELALRFLAKVGILLHFEDSRAGLNELFFIDPAWVCRTVSDMLESTKVRNQLEESGFITAERLTELVLKPRNIPASNCRHIIQMIEVLEIIIEDSQGRYLIPSFLPAGKFPIKKTKKISEQVQRLYGFSNLPIEFWPRLISRFINFSVSQSSLWDGIDIDARKEGIKIIWNDGTRLIIQSRSSDYIQQSCRKEDYQNLTWCGSDCSDHYLSVTDIEAWVEITVYLNSTNSKVILGDCIDAIDNLIQGNVLFG